MTNCSVLWWKEYGEKALYSLGTDGKRYFSSWSESRWPRQDEDGRDLVPAENIDDGWNGIAWFDTFDQAMQDMVDIIEAIGISDHEWAKEALEELETFKEELRMKFEVYEDGSGTLHLFVWDEEEGLAYYNCYLDPVDAASDINNLMVDDSTDGWTLPDMDVDPLEYAEEIYPTMQRDATLVMDEAAIYLDGDIGYAGHEMIRQLINLIDEEE